MFLNVKTVNKMPIHEIIHTFPEILCELISKDLNNTAKAIIKTGFVFFLFQLISSARLDKKLNQNVPVLRGRRKVFFEKEKKCKRN